MNEEDDKIKKLPIRFKTQPGEEAPMLKVVHYDGKCNHRQFYKDGKMVHVTYQIREGETEVECSHCGTRLDPMFVLKILAVEENRWMETRKNYQAEMKRLNERSRTKCKHCGQMTPISRK
ncbi:hypothetical protein [Brucella intermedia]|uniref:Uncharacterized protein n=1 Tax=Brucella intermedia M86 TaxID=1234597 RepID=M5JLF1_9HYPH|nr:hypothetical protein [Brucella intermedia]ELT47398.1 hypothetical protein D584_19898 [Brucella intermedia M86]